MPNKKVTLYAPQQADDGRWILQVDLDLGMDTLRLSAWVSPETIAWARRYAQKGWSWARSKTQAIGEKLGTYIELKGDWKELGPIADIVASTAYQLTQHTLVSDYSTMKDGVAVLRDWKGENGYEAQLRAAELVANIQELAAMGDAQAVERGTILNHLIEADALLSAEDSYERLSLLAESAGAGDPYAIATLQACKAFGNCGCGCTKKNPMQISVDAGALYNQGAEGRIDQIAGFASSAMTMRALKGRGNTGTVTFFDGMRQILCSVVDGQIQACQPVELNAVGFVPDELEAVQ